MQKSFSVSNFAARNQYDYKMKTRMMKLLMAVLTLSMPMLQSEMCADTILVEDYISNRHGISLLLTLKQDKL
ncbi:hypothetical protein SAMN04487852_105203 [Prevotella sp. tf2-5]|nr:hypothetical protein SAMN04487852_105203 [Prevotella sp. tf2-5]